MSKKNRTAPGNEFSTLIPLIGFTFLLLVFAAPIGPDLNDHMLVKSSLVEVYVGILAILFLFKFNDGKLYFIKESIPALLILFVIWGMISLFWSANTDYGIVLLFKWLTGALLATLVFQIRSYDELMKIPGYLFLACVILSFIGIIQYLFGFDLISQNKSPASTFANKNMAGQIVVLSWMLGAYLFVRNTSKEPLVQYYYAIGTSLALSYAVYTNSRAVWLSIFAQILLLTVFLLAAKVQKVKVIDFRRINGRAAAVAAILFLLLVNFNGNGFKPIWETLGSRLAEIETETAIVEGAEGFKRFLLWNSTIDMIKDKPLLGAGLGGFEATHQQYAYGDTVYSAHAHNDYLQYTAELGVVAVLLIVSIGGLFIYKAIGLISRTGESHNFPRYVVLALLAGIAVDAVFSFPLQLIGPTILVSGLLGVFFRLGCLEGIKAKGIKAKGIKEEDMPVTTEKSISLKSLARPVILTFLIPFTLVMAWAHLEWSLTLDELSEVASKKRTKQALDLATLIEPPTFRRFVWILTNDYRSIEPRKAEKIAKAYALVNDNDVIVNNTLALTGILRKNYTQARLYLKKARALETDGNYSSYVSELVMYGQLKDLDGLRKTLNILESEPRKMVMAQKYNLVAMGTTAYQLGELDHAVDLLEENIRAYPGFDASYTPVIQILVKLKRHSEAREKLEKLKVIVGDTPLTEGLGKLVDS